MKSIGLFAGIGGIELGFEEAGISCEFLSEINDAASIVLQREFEDVPLIKDIHDITSVPDVEIVAGGFPCQNLSLVGDKTGIHGEKSSLVNQFFRIIQLMKKKPKWIVLENVPFMLWQKKGEAMRYVTGLLEAEGYTWAHRVLDSRAFGNPQRRRRVLFVASRSEDPRTVLFTDEAEFNFDIDPGNVPCGFYWTEGKFGLGWAQNAVPTLKGGSGIGIPSLPAIWFRETGEFGTPEIRDAERLQGFSSDWTDVEVEGKKIKLGYRCSMVGNAVSVPMSKWLGSRIKEPQDFDESRQIRQFENGVWPNAAWGKEGKIFEIKISEHPHLEKYIGLNEFLKHPIKPLSHRASTGFLKRARASKLRFADGFLDAVENHIKHMSIVENKG